MRNHQETFKEDPLLYFSDSILYKYQSVSDADKDVYTTGEEVEAVSGVAAAAAACFLAWILL